MISKTQKFWDKQAKKYDDSERQFEPVFKEIILRTKSYLTTDDNALDFGCATGTKTIALADSVRHIHGFDISTEMICEANKKIIESDLKNISFIQGDIYNDIFGKAMFDKIVSYGVIHLLDDSEKIIRRIHELLKPNGLFISSTACLKSKMTLKNKLVFNAYLMIKKSGFFPLHLSMFEPDNVERIIVNQGFQIVKAETIFHGITISFIIAKKA
ncbi:MAG: class I SAM-dependent methyltransferase [Calditrichaceae bacterium]|nr:class I SAM-dependent methyltransferase [Calditrichaceae bacterium]MBN2709845.1 class I SAM-dependent methyltransferase [Calditrichaceae bacterium]RQV95393.1 MAG: class I SAM-dependent methyltransferase [Calditrichota bacterium]